MYQHSRLDIDLYIDNVLKTTVYELLSKENRVTVLCLHWFENSLETDDCFQLSIQACVVAKKQQSPLYQLKLVCNNEMCRVLKSMVIDRFVIVTVHVEYTCMSCNIQQHRSHA